MFSKGENGYLYLHDDQGRVLQVVGDGWTWIYRYGEDGQASVTRHPSEPAATAASAQPEPDWYRKTYMSDVRFDPANPVTYYYDATGFRLK